MDDYSIVIRPIVTEQGMHFANVKGAYSFEVHRKANKAEIRERHREDLWREGGQGAHGEPQGQTAAPGPQDRHHGGLEESRRVPGAG